MREIKCRGKRADGKWVYGYLVKDDCEYLIGADVDSMFDVVPETVGQFTGKFDCDGFEIYEGDIVMIGTLTNDKTRYEVRWLENFSFGAIDEIGCVLSLSNYSFCIVGNIYERVSK